MLSWNAPKRNSWSYTLILSGCRLPPSLSWPGSQGASPGICNPRRKVSIVRQAQRNDSTHPPPISLSPILQNLWNIKPCNWIWNELCPWWTWNAEGGTFRNRKENEIYFQQVKVQLRWLRAPHPLSTQPVKQQENHDISPISLMCCYVWHLQWIKSPCRNFGCWSLRRQMAQEDISANPQGGLPASSPQPGPASLSLMLAPEWTWTTNLILTHKLHIFLLPPFPSLYSPPPI